jgi:hypothetical protein
VKRIECFFYARHVLRKDGGPHRFRMEMIARGTGAVLYRSAPYDTLEKARDVIKKYAEKHADRFEVTAVCLRCKKHYATMEPCWITVLCDACAGRS